MPKISVIIPVYNVEQHLQKCLESVVVQTFKDIEIICIDDGSTDGCPQILEEFAAKDKRIKVITQPNKGLSVARNVGLEHAVAEQVSYVDSDDFIHPKFLQTLYEVAQKYNADIVGCDFLKIYTDEALPEFGEVEPKEYKPALDILLNRKNFIHFNVWNKLYKRDIIKDVKFVEGIYFEDWVYNSCVFADAKNFVWIDAKLYGYRISENSIMRSQFNRKKLDDYVEGIRQVRKFYKEKHPETWCVVRETRIARTVKMLMNSTRRSHDQELYAAAKIALKKLYNLKLIGYSGLSCVNKMKLFRFLH